MRVLVFAPSIAGHHSFYLRLLLPALSKLSSDVTLVTVRNASKSPEFRTHLQDIDCERVECVLPSESGSLTKRGSAKLRGLMKAIETFRPDHVYVPAADHLTQMMGIRRRSTRRASSSGDLEMEGLMMRGGFAYPFRGNRQWVQDRLSLVAIERAPWSILHYVDPISYAMLQRRGGSISRRVRLMPDPVDLPTSMDRGAARRDLGVPEDGRYVGSVGMMDTRKGIDLMIRAFATAPLHPSDRLLLVGQSSSEVRRLLVGPMVELVRRNRIIAIDQYVDNEKFLAAVSAMDVVCAPYPQHIGSASIAIRAAAAERPLLASSFGWLGMVVPRFGLGSSCDVSDTKRFASAIAAALENSSQFRLSEGARRFVQYHSVENFQAAWTARLRDRLGLPTMAMQRSWNWVLEAPLPGESES